MNSMTNLPEDSWSQGQVTEYFKSYSEREDDNEDDNEKRDTFQAITYPSPMCLATGEKTKAAEKSTLQ